MRLEGPRTNGEAAVIQAAKEKANKPPPNREGFEHLLTTLDLRKYLEEKHPKRADICKYPIGCEIGDVEPVLLADLNREKEVRSISKDRVNHLRKILRASSFRSHSQENKTALTRIAESLVNEVADKQRELARTEPEEAKEYDDIRRMAEDIVRVLQRPLYGEEAETAVLAVEHFFDVAKRERKDAATINRLRALRDQLYFQHLYPKWFEAGMK